MRMHLQYMVEMTKLNWLTVAKIIVKMQ